MVPGRLAYYSVEVTGPGGGVVGMTGFGRQVQARGAGLAEVVFPVGESVVTEIPIGTLYEMRRTGEYRVRISGAGVRTSERVVSNELVIER